MRNLDIYSFPEFNRDRKQSERGGTGGGLKHRRRSGEAIPCSEPPLISRLMVVAGGLRGSQTRIPGVVVARGSGEQDLTQTNSTGGIASTGRGPTEDQVLGAVSSGIYVRGREGAGGNKTVGGLPARP